MKKLLALFLLAMSAGAMKLELEINDSLASGIAQVIAVKTMPYVELNVDLYKRLTEWLAGRVVTHTRGHVIGSSSIAHELAKTVSYMDHDTKKFCTLVDFIIEKNFGKFTLQLSMAELQSCMTESERSWIIERIEKGGFTVIDEGSVPMTLNQLVGSGSVEK